MNLYAEGVRLFQEGHWFEAHEVLETLWKATPAGEEKRYYQGLIQLSVSLEHWRRQNPRGALGQWKKGAAKMEGLPAVYRGLELAELLQAFEVFYGGQQIEEALRLQQQGLPIPTVPLPSPSPAWSQDRP